MRTKNINLHSKQSHERIIEKNKVYNVSHTRIRITDTYKMFVEKLNNKNKSYLFHLVVLSFAFLFFF